MTSSVPPVRMGRLTRILATARWPVTSATLLLVLVSTLWGAFPDGPPPVQLVQNLLSLLILLLVIIMVVITRWGAGPPRAGYEVVVPVDGQWKIVSSPGERVPSHGTHTFGQGWAVDMLHASPGFVPFSIAGRILPAEHFPAYGQTVRAGVSGTVVLARDSAKDHGSRNSWLLLPLLFLESVFRGIGGEKHVFGNLVVIAMDEGPYLALAHLQQRSVKVRVGDRVSPEMVVARCGNSGNSSEPHLHLQVMDRPSPTFAAGLPFVFTDVTGTELPMPARNQFLDGGRVDRMPAP